MKKLLIVFAICASANIYAQQLNINEYQKSSTKKPTLIGFSLGLNNPSGILGVRINSGISNNSMIDIGAGVGSWGYKLSSGIILMADKDKGLTPVLGLSYATGLEDLEFKGADVKNNNSMPSVIEVKDVTLNLKPAIAANIGAQWQFYSKSGNRGFLEFGYSFLMAGGGVEVKENGYSLTNEYENVIKFLRPGGLILGFTYMWKLD